MFIFIRNLMSNSMENWMQTIIFVTTYTAILIQFQMADENAKKERKWTLHYNVLHHCQLNGEFSHHSDKIIIHSISEQIFSFVNWSNRIVFLILIIADLIRNARSCVIFVCRFLCFNQQLSIYFVLFFFLTQMSDINSNENGKQMSIDIHSCSLWNFIMGFH